jgi:hypothetical protein
MAFFFLLKSVPLANGENSGNCNGVCRYVPAWSLQRDIIEKTNIFWTFGIGNSSHLF